MSASGRDRRIGGVREVDVGQRVSVVGAGRTVVREGQPLPLGAILALEADVVRGVPDCREFVTLTVEGDPLASRDLDGRAGLDLEVRIDRQVGPGGVDTVRAPATSQIVGSGAVTSAEMSVPFPSNGMTR